MKRLLIPALLCVALLAAIGAGKPASYGGSSYGGQGATYAAGGAAKVDTVKVRSRTVTFPNSAAITAGYSLADSSKYSYDNKADNGTTVRWCWIRKDAATTVTAPTTANASSEIWSRPHSTEDDHTLNAAQRYGFFWVSANGLARGQRIQSAYFMVNATSGFTTSGSTTFYCRLDTIGTDYSIRAGSTSGYYGTNNDAGCFDASWTNTSQRLGTAWNPALDTRLDYHDFGPRSANRFPAATYAQGYCFRFDMTDAVQQMVDRPDFDATRGLLFIIYGTGGTSESSQSFAAGNAPTAIRAAKGNPVFTAVATTRRGEQAWGGVPVPIVFMWDDSYDAQVGYYGALRTAGETFTAALSGYGMSTHDWPDSILALGRTDYKVVAHSKFHESLGRVSADSLTQDLSRKWMVPYFPLAGAAFDTTTIVDYAWPGNDRKPNRGLNAITAMIDHGYRSSRSGGYWWTAGETAVWHDTRLSWSGYVNRYLIWSYNAANLFAVGGIPATEAQVADELGDMIDEAYTDYARAPVFVYGHSYDELDVNEFATPAMLAYVAGLAAAQPNIEIMDYGTVVGMRLAGATTLTPAQVASMRGVGVDSNMIQTMAADQDSAYTADSDPNYLQMWIGPK